MKKEFNAAFWRWFGDSAATDEDYNPLLLYHGTPYAGFAEFSTKGQAIGYHGVGIYLTDSTKAAERYGFDRYYDKDYKGDPFRKAIVPVYASIQRCFDQRRFYTADEIDSIVPENAPVRKSAWNSSHNKLPSGRLDNSRLNRLLDWIDTDHGGEIDGRDLIRDTQILEKEVDGKRFQERVSDQQPVWARDWGLDGIIVLDAISTRGGVKHVNRSDDKRKAINNLTVIVKDSKQIKSAIGNDGTYDADDPDIRSNPDDDAEISLGIDVKDPFVAAWHGRDRVGELWVGDFDDPPLRAAWLAVLDVSVKPKFRSKGITKRMYKLALEESKRYGYKGLAAWLSNRLSPQAIDMIYSSLGGYEEDGIAFIPNRGEE